MATLLSVNVGLPKVVAWQGRTVYTGIWKRPVEGPRIARRLNIDGDGQGDLSGHAGEQRAVSAYQIESYRHWQNHLGRDAFELGQFGENFTVEGLPDGEVCIGDRIGEAEFEVPNPVSPAFASACDSAIPSSPMRHLDRRAPPTWPSLTSKPPTVNSPGGGVQVSAIRHKSPTGDWTAGWQPGADAKYRDYASFADFADPDGNTWVLQEIGYRARAPSASPS